MKIDTNKRNNLPVFNIEDKDSEGILHLRQLIAGKFTCSACGRESDNFSWQSLQGYFSSLRKWIEEMGKSHAQSRVKRDICSNDFSILTGIDLAIGLPEKLITQSELIDRIRKDKETQNDGTTDDDAGE